MNCEKCHHPFSVEKGQRPVIVCMDHIQCESCVVRVSGNLFKCSQCEAKSPSDRTIDQLVNRQVLQLMKSRNQHVSYRCPNHVENKPIELYCPACDILMCGLCGMQHIDHTDKLPKYVDKDIVNDANELIDSMQKVQDACELNKSELKKLIEGVHTEDTLKVISQCSMFVAQLSQGRVKSKYLRCKLDDGNETDVISIRRKVHESSNQVKASGESIPEKATMHNNNFVGRDNIADRKMIAVIDETSRTDIGHSDVTSIGIEAAPRLTRQQSINTVETRPTTPQKHDEPTVNATLIPDMIDTVWLRERLNVDFLRTIYTGYCLADVAKTNSEAKGSTVLVAKVFATSEIFLIPMPEIYDSNVFSTQIKNGKTIRNDSAPYPQIVKFDSALYLRVFWEKPFKKVYEYNVDGNIRASFGTSFHCLRRKATGDFHVVQILWGEYRQGLNGVIPKINGRVVDLKNNMVITNYKQMLGKCGNQMLSEVIKSSPGFKLNKGIKAAEFLLEKLELLEGSKMRVVS